MGRTGPVRRQGLLKADSLHRGACPLQSFQATARLSSLPAVFPGREQSVRLLPRAPGGQPPARPPHIAGIPGLASWDPTLERNQAALEKAGSEQGVFGKTEATGGG